MSATSNQGVTHDVGDRISITLRPVISVNSIIGSTGAFPCRTSVPIATPPAGSTISTRSNEATVDLYNEKFRQARKSIMDKLYAAKKLTPTPSTKRSNGPTTNLWHHQGRRARMGTAMMGPDYAQWHGFYEVAKPFTRNSFRRPNS